MPTTPATMYRLALKRVHEQHGARFGPAFEVDTPTVDLPFPVWIELGRPGWIDVAPVPSPGTGPTLAEVWDEGYGTGRTLDGRPDTHAVNPYELTR